MEKRTLSRKQLYTLFAMLIVLIVTVRIYYAHELRHQHLDDAITQHIAAIQSDVDYAVEQTYTVQALVVGFNGTDIDLKRMEPVLQKEDIDRVLRCIALAPGGVVNQVLPLEGNEALLGINLFDNNYSTAEEAKKAWQSGELVMTRPFIMPNGERVVVARAPVFLPKEDGTYTDWGMVSVCLAFPELLRDLSIDILREQGFAYKIFLLLDDAEGTEIEVVNCDYTGNDHYIEREFFIADNHLKILATPVDGWLPVDKTVEMVLEVVTFLIVLGVLIRLAARRIRKLYRQVTLDSMTGLLNRAAGEKRVDQMIRGKEFQQGAFLMMDIDCFKDVNDRFGHQQGDETLIECAHVLRKLFRKGDVICRLGGDEFVVFLPFHRDMSILHGKVERLLEAMRRDVVGDKDVVRISASIGIAIAPDHGTTFDELYHHADEALYHSKEQGRDRMTVYGAFKDREPDAERQLSLFDIEQARHIVLIVDNDVANREIIKNILPSQYCFEEADNGWDGLKKIEIYGEKLAAIITAVNIPEIGGMELLEILKEKGIPAKIPVFLITYHGEEEIARKAYELGVIDVIRKPVTPFVILRRLQTVIELYHAREALSATVQSQKKQLRKQVDTINELHRGTIEALASAIEFRDVESGEHINRIYGITKHILSRTDMGKGFSDQEIENMAIGSIMHDVGKIAISDIILNKPGKLTQEEFEIMKQHTIKGAALMEQLSRMQNHPAYQYARDIARHHHERWDGSGYPDGLKGDEIEVWTQVVSIADVYDALISSRVYKKKVDPEQAVRMICDGECGAFNPKLLEYFLQVEPDLRNWYAADEEKRSQGVIQAAGDDGSLPTVEPDGMKSFVDVLLLTAAVKSSYDMIICANLTQNSYYMIDYDRFLTRCADYDGVFDALIVAGASSVPESHRQQFLDQFSRQSLLEAYGRGEKSVHLEHPQYTDDGALMSVSTSVLFMEDPRNGDIRQITLARYLGRIDDAGS